MSEWVSEWVTDWMSEWVSEWATDWVSDRLASREVLASKNKLKTDSIVVLWCSWLHVSNNILTIWEITDDLFSLGNGIYSTKQIGKTKFSFKNTIIFFIIFNTERSSFVLLSVCKIVFSNCSSVYPIPDELWPGCFRFCENSPRIHWGIVWGNVQEHLGQLYYLYSW